MKLSIWKNVCWSRITFHVLFIIWFLPLVLRVFWWGWSHYLRWCRGRRQHRGQNIGLPPWLARWAAGGDCCYGNDSTAGPHACWPGESERQTKLHLQGLISWQTFNMWYAKQSCLSGWQTCETWLSKLSPKKQVFDKLLIGRRYSFFLIWFQQSLYKKVTLILLYMYIFFLFHSIESQNFMVAFF